MIGRAALILPRIAEEGDPEGVEAAARTASGLAPSAGFAGPPPHRFATGRIK